MITVGVIRNGGTYLSQHLRKNDYWAEGEKQVCGEWIGQAATMLGLAGVVTDAPFEALRANRDWQTGKRLTARANKKTRMALFDIQISAPKDVSVLAMVGGDERVREAFTESVQAVLVEMDTSRPSASDAAAHATPRRFGSRGILPAQFSCTTPAAISIRSFTFTPCSRTRRGTRSGRGGWRSSTQR